MAFKNKVQVLFLPAHTSHKTQPLDRSVFSALKTYYRQQTKPLTACRGSAPAHKQHFLLAYRDASREGVSPTNVKSGFKKTGIWPFNPSQVLNDPKALIRNSPPPPKRPQTPEIAPISADNAVKTPQKSHDILRAVNNARGYASPTNRTVRSVLRKAGKALDQSNAKMALLEAENARLKEDLRVTEPCSRKKVKEPLNGKFIRIGDIVTAEEASQKPLKRR